MVLFSNIKLHDHGLTHGKRESESSLTIHKTSHNRDYTIYNIRPLLMFFDHTVSNINTTLYSNIIVIRMTMCHIKERPHYWS